MEQFKKIKQFGEWHEEDGVFKIKNYIVKPTGLGGNPVKGYKIQYTVLLHTNSNNDKNHWLNIKSGLSLDEAMIYVEEKLGLREKREKNKFKQELTHRIKELLKDSKANKKQIQEANLSYGQVLIAMNEARLDEIVRTVNLLNRIGITELDDNNIYDIINEEMGN